MDWILPQVSTRALRWWRIRKIFCYWVLEAFNQLVNFRKFLQKIKENTKHQYHIIIFTSVTLTVIDCELRSCHTNEDTPLKLSTTMTWQKTAKLQWLRKLLDLHLLFQHGHRAVTLFKSCSWNIEMAIPKASAFSFIILGAHTPTRNFRHRNATDECMDMDSWIGRHVDCFIGFPAEAGKQNEK